MESISINGRAIGPNQPCYIIAEIGSNYNGDLKTAKKMIDIAKNCGVDAVKFQIFKENTLYPPCAGTVDYLNMDKSINDLVKENEVPNEFHLELLNYCREHAITYLCTPTDEALSDYLDDIGVSAFKIASYALTHLPLLKHIAKKGKPIILSTGGTNLEEISEAVKVIREAGNDQLMLMQCVSQYPADINHTNLRVISTLREAFNLPVGMSDHSRDPYIVPYASAAVGANLLEKHYTLDRRQDGPDHSFAVEPEELGRMVHGVRSVESAMGTSEKFVSPVEYEMRSFAQRSIFVNADLEAGSTISRTNIAILRPGKLAAGISPKYYDRVIGAQLVKSVKRGSALNWSDLITYGEE